jgi:hypothetical protein
MVSNGLRLASRTIPGSLIVTLGFLGLPPSVWPQEITKSHVLLSVSATIRESEGGAKLSVSGNVRVSNEVSSPDGHCLMSLDMDLTRLQGTDETGRLYAILRGSDEYPAEPCPQSRFKAALTTFMISRASGVRSAPLTLIYNLFFDESGRLTDNSFVEIQSPGSP